MDIGVGCYTGATVGNAIARRFGGHWAYGPLFAALYGIVNELAGTYLKAGINLLQEQ